MQIIKTIIDEIVTHFTYICNQPFLSGTFPNKIKLAKVISLYKTGNQNVFTYYRSVSLLPQFSIYLLPFLVPQTSDNLVTSVHG